MNITVAFLWHMHQPYYRDMVSGESTMPWVRLHGIHSYYDMLRLYQRIPSARCTINFVPSLMEQLLAYTAEGKSDVFLDHTLVPAKDLTLQQKVFLLRHFFMVNAERKILPVGPYGKLFQRLGLDRANIDFNQAVRFFSTQDYLDLQTYYNLVWFGFAAREEIPQLNQMLAGGGHFTEEDKLFVVESQRHILAKLVEEIRKAANSENVEICTTPYFHPIFPLLIDTDFARRSNPRAPLPPRLRMPEVARHQLQHALDSMERWTGKRPRGIWPAEGSVCPEMIPMLSDAGVSWFATDDRVLSASLSYESRDTNLHQPFLATSEGTSVGIVFRDHGLADLISFTYSRLPAQAAVADFIGHLKEIDRYGKGAKQLVTVVMDGENPWEFYPDSGKEFLFELFTAFEREGIATARLGDYLEQNPPARKIEKLHTGSWIDANFNIWIGKTQKNQGWGYIKRTLDDLGSELTHAAREANPQAASAYESLCAACGSDWFWWYDDDFESAFKGDFDRIFRGHLKNVYAQLGKEVPLFLFEPIYRFEAPEESFIEPPGCITPAIDGLETSFFEWSNASHITVHGRSTGAMAMGSIDPFETLSFGFNERAFYVRIDPIDRDNGFTLSETEHVTLRIYDGSRRLKYWLGNEGPALAVKQVDEAGKLVEAAGVQMAAKEILEMGFDFAALGLSTGEKVTIAISLNRHGVEVRRYSHIRFVVPDETYNLRMWSV